jgi:hypothetical protein
MKRAWCFVFVVAVALGLTAAPTAAQDTGCAPLEVAPDSGVYFLVLGGSCSSAQAEGYVLVAHLIRDDDSSELLVLLDSTHTDNDTLIAAQVLASEVEAGTIDDAPWHEVPLPSDSG